MLKEQPFLVDTANMALIFGGRDNEYIDLQDFVADIENNSGLCLKEADKALAKYNRDIAHEEIVKDLEVIDEKSVHWIGERQQYAIGYDKAEKEFVTFDKNGEIHLTNKDIKEMVKDFKEKGFVSYRADFKELASVEKELEKEYGEKTLSQGRSR